MAQSRISFNGFEIPRVLCTRSCETEPYVKKLSNTGQRKARSHSFALQKMKKPAAKMNGNRSDRHTCSLDTRTRSFPNSLNVGRFSFIFGF